MRIEEIFISLQLFCTGIDGALDFLFGGADGFLHTLIVFMVIDYLMGVMRAILERTISGRIGFRGIFKKLVILYLVSIGHMLDEYVIKSGNTIRTAIIFFYLSNEGISIVDHVSAIGVPVPKKLVKTLLRFKQGEEDKDKCKVENRESQALPLLDNKQEKEQEQDKVNKDEKKK